MSENIYQASAPICENPGCTNITNKSPKQYRISRYTKYCCKECQISGQSLRRSATMQQKANSLIIPKCVNPQCCNLVTTRSGYKWNQCCCRKCAAAVGVPKGLNKRFDTNIKKYGGNSPMAADSVKQNQKNKIFEKYGVYNPGQHPDIRKKAVNTGKNKEYIMPSGNIVKIQGYEYKTLDELFLTYTEIEIEISASGNVPTIRYINDIGKESIYFPDFYIPKDNLIIETKSKYWFEKYKDKNILKEKACVAAGFSFRWMIY